MIQLNKLHSILDRLEPGMSLVLDRPAFMSAFGFELGSKAGDAEAIRFAKVIGCQYRYLLGTATFQPLCTVESTEEYVIKA